MAVQCSKAEACVRSHPKFRGVNRQALASALQSDPRSPIPDLSSIEFLHIMLFDPLGTTRSQCSESL
jgi:hypothetical protein